MIKQDFLLRMIREIITLIADALIHRKKIRKQDWIEYDTLTWQILGIPTEELYSWDVDRLLVHYEADPNRMEKLELAAMTLLKLADDAEGDDLLLKAKLQQDGIRLLKYVREHGNTYSLQREFLLQLLDVNH